MMRALKFTALRIVMTLTCLVLWALLTYRPIQISVSPSAFPAVPVLPPTIQPPAPFAPPPASASASEGLTGEYIKGADHPSSESAGAASAPTTSAPTVDAEVERIEKALERIKGNPVTRERFYSELNDLITRVRGGEKTPQNSVLDPGKARVKSKEDFDPIRNCVRQFADVADCQEKGGPKQ